MVTWQENIQNLIFEIDRNIKEQNDDALTLSNLAKSIGYSEYYLSRKFKEISGMQLRDFLRGRRLAFALKDLRETEEGILEIAIRYGFSSHEAFTRAFKEPMALLLVTTE